jgi:hypothetical protein
MAAVILARRAYFVVHAVLPCSASSEFAERAGGRGRTFLARASNPF